MSKAEIQKRYQQSEKGKRTRQRYSQSAHGRQTIRDWWTTPAGKAAQQERDSRPATIAAKNAKRTAAGDVYFSRIMRKRLHEAESPCNLCGALYEPTHQMDHVVAIAIALLIGYQYTSEADYQMLCRSCHIWKSTYDARDVITLKELLRE